MLTDFSLQVKNLLPEFFSDQDVYMVALFPQSQMFMEPMKPIEPVELPAMAIQTLQTRI